MRKKKAKRGRPAKAKRGRPTKKASTRRAKPKTRRKKVYLAPKTQKGPSSADFQVSILLNEIINQLTNITKAINNLAEDYRDTNVTCITAPKVTQALAEEIHGASAVQ